MKRLEDLSLTHRVLLAISIVVLVVLMLITLSRIIGDEATGQTKPPSYEISEYELDMLQLEREGIDTAFKDQVTNVFAVWMKDPTGQPARAVVGVVQARKAYSAARKRLEERESDYNKTVWTPP
jgi:hypothetical protein